MATKKSNNTETPQEETEFAAPVLEMDGGTVIESGDERLYWQVQEGEVIQGEYLVTVPGTINDRPVKYHVIRTTVDGVLVTDADKDADGDVREFRVPKDTNVHVNVRHNIQQLDRLMDYPRVVEIGIQAVKQVPIRGGQTVWRFKVVGKDTGRERRGNLGSAIFAQLPSRVGGEDVPF